MLLAWGLLSFAQGIYNDGAHIVSTSGSYWVVDNGDFTLTSTTYETEFDNLTIMSDASLTLDSDPLASFMTVNNTFEIEEGGAFTAESGSSVITNGLFSASGTSMTFNRSITGANAWHMLSAPTLTAIFSETDVQNFSPGDDDDFYAWYEPAPGIWVNYKTSSGQNPTFLNVNSNSDNFIPGNGYLVSYLVSVEKKFVGLPNTGSYDFTLSYNGSKSTEWNYVNGWNLMGNPYPSSYNWQFGTDPNLFQDVYAYVYDQNENSGAGGYIYIGGAGGYPPNLAPNQGFFVIAKSTANGSSYTFLDDKRTHDGANPFRNSSVENDEFLILTVESSKYSNKLTIYQNPESTYERDRYDAIKMYSFNDEVPSMYSFSTDEVRLAINSMPEIIGQPVNIGFKLPSQGVYTLNLTKIPSQLMLTPIYLEDKLSNNWSRIDLSSISFTADGGELNDRFVLHMGIVGIDESNTANPIQVYSNGKGINVINNNNLTGEITILNILGQQMDSFKLESNINQSRHADFPSGVYVVYVKTSDGHVYSEKVIVN